MIAARPRSLSGGYSRTKRDLRKVLLANAFSSTGDGIYMAAMPLLAVSVTVDPFKVGIIGAAEYLPALLLGPLIGLIIDRTLYVRLLRRMDILRLVVMVVFIALIFTDWLTIWTIVPLAFLAGIGQVAFDTTAQAFLPGLIGRDEHALRRTNAVLQSIDIAGNRLIGPIIGSITFSISTVIPFIGNAASFVVSWCVLGTVKSRDTASRDATAGNSTIQRRNLVSEARGAISWLIGDHLLRQLLLMAAGANLAFSTGFAMFGLMIKEVLSLPDYFVGVAFAAQAVGGLFGTLIAGKVAWRVAPGLVLAPALVANALSLLFAGISVTGWQFALWLSVSGLCVTTQGVITSSMRQSVIPREIMGRVLAVYRSFTTGAIPVGTLVGGIVGAHWGVRSAFLVASGMVLLTASLTLPRILALPRMGKILRDGQGH